jgi:flagellar basal body-associated protein FliL
MAIRFKEMLTNPEKRAKLLYWIWIISLIMTVLGYILIFYFLYWTHK